MAPPATPTPSTPHVPPAPLPSASVILLSPTNQVLLLHRATSSPAFPAAHVFPGGGLDAHHDATPPVPDPTALALHTDGPAYRRAAIRECFEECGVLLARTKGGSDDELLSLPSSEIEAGRRRVLAGEVRFSDWVEQMGGVLDLDNLVPFTRWITPITSPRRFTIQMYLYLLPVDSNSPRTHPSSAVPDSAGDGGLEITSATFAPAAAWLRMADAHQIALYPPQYYLLHLIARFTSHIGSNSSSSSSSPSYSSSGHTSTAAALSSLDEILAQRRALLAFIHDPPNLGLAPSAEPPQSPLSPMRLYPREAALARIPPGEKVICPRTLFVRGRDGRVVLGLDEPGPELATMEGRGGDGDRVVIVAFGEGGEVRNVEIRDKAKVLGEEREISTIGDVVARED